MQSPVRIVVSTFLLTSVIASAYHSSAKLRRDGVLNLYPFPRVGRASKHTWQVPLSDFYLEYEPMTAKRQLYAFPRVGRSDATLLRDQFPGAAAGGAEEAQRADGPGMWFGPRLGRSFKTDEDEISIQGDNTGRSDPEQMESTPHEDRKKRQTKLN
ncbi:unnamed protein product [Chilo suppressalis]|uniref:Insect neuropeptide n=1 Tax=Chilo suppressalis TaxID=168631 RepID=A0A0S1U2A8_CHISP|nr:insect neuropeptide [Chilo suppressalis]CAH0663577.1 unnamed protein product [Chilo suppressalis]